MRQLQHQQQDSSGSVEEEAPLKEDGHAEVGMASNCAPQGEEEDMVSCCAPQHRRSFVLLASVSPVMLLLFGGLLLTLRESNSLRQQARETHEKESAFLQQQVLTLEAKLAQLKKEKAHGIDPLRRMLPMGRNDSQPALRTGRNDSQRAPPQQLRKMFRAGSAPQPEMYGKVPEKTIWSYWHNPETCPSSFDCKLPAHIQLCIETVQKNRGSFEHKVVHLDEVEKYLTPQELPLRFVELGEAQQKDALINALLARYGGVSLDISMILLRSLDDYWEEMVNKGATFRGYMYRLNGQPWRHNENMVVWFLMSRREGIFGPAVRDQVTRMGDSTDFSGYGDWYMAFGDQTLLPVLSMYNYTFPRCFDDTTVPEPEKCPEYQQPPWFEGITGPELGPSRLMLADPRDGPQMPFAWLGMETWNVRDSTDRSASEEWADNARGAPMHLTGCRSMKECWETEFLPRYQTRRLNFVKFFKHGESLAHKSRTELLLDRDSFFYQWLRIAGLPVDDEAGHVEEQAYIRTLGIQ